MQNVRTIFELLQKGVLGVGIVAVPAAFNRLGWAVALACICLLAAASQFSRFLHERLLSALDAATLSPPQSSRHSQGVASSLAAGALRSAQERLVRLAMRAALLLTPPLYHIACVESLQQVLGPCVEVPKLVLGLFLAAAAVVLSQLTLFGSSWFQVTRRAAAAAMMVALLLLTGAELDVLQQKQESGGQPQTDVVASGDWSSYLTAAFYACMWQVGFMILVFASSDQHNWLVVQGVNSAPPSQRNNKAGSRQQHTPSSPAIFICPPTDFDVSTTAAPPATATDTSRPAPASFNTPSPHSSPHRSPRAVSTHSSGAINSRNCGSLAALALQSIAIAVVGALGYAAFGNAVNSHIPVTSLLAGELSRVWVVLVNSVLLLALLLGYSAHLHLWGSMLLSASQPAPVTALNAGPTPEQPQTVAEAVGSAIAQAEAGQPELFDSGQWGSAAEGSLPADLDSRQRDRDVGVQRVVYSMMEPGSSFGTPDLGSPGAAHTAASAAAAAMTAAATATSAAHLAAHASQQSEGKVRQLIGEFEEVIDTLQLQQQLQQQEAHAQANEVAGSSSGDATAPTAVSSDVHMVVPIYGGGEEFPEEEQPAVESMSDVSQPLSHLNLLEPLLLLSDRGSATVGPAGDIVTHATAQYSISSGQSDLLASQPAAQRWHQLTQRFPRPLSVGDELLLRLLGSAAGASVGWVLGYGLPYFAELVALVGSLGGLWGLLVLPCMLLQADSRGGAGAKAFVVMCRVVAVAAAGVALVGFAAAVKQVWLANAQ
ncbi:MAG: hypothetical protein WDW36_005240 [Sanguina aurantia]